MGRILWSSRERNKMARPDELVAGSKTTDQGLRVMVPRQKNGPEIRANEPIGLQDFL